MPTRRHVFKIFFFFQNSSSRLHRGFPALEIIKVLHKQAGGVTECKRRDVRSCPRDQLVHHRKQSMQKKLVNGEIVSNEQLDSFLVQ